MVVHGVTPATLPDLDLDQVRLSKVRREARPRGSKVHLRGKVCGRDGLGSPASAPNLPTDFSVGNAS